MLTIRKIMTPDIPPTISPFAFVILEVVYPLIKQEILQIPILIQESSSRGKDFDISNNSDRTHNSTMVVKAPVVVPAINAFIYKDVPLCVKLVLIVFKIKIP